MTRSAKVVTQYSVIIQSGVAMARGGVPKVLRCFKGPQIGTRVVEAQINYQIVVDLELV
jgi:hypothetical protein